MVLLILAARESLLVARIIMDSTGGFWFAEAGKALGYKKNIRF